MEHGTAWRRSFFTIWTGQAFSLLGSQLVQFALIWYLTERTGSATVLAMAMLVGMLPQIFVGPFAGALVDRWNRRRVMIIADGGIALATALLALLFALNVVQVWHVYVLLLARSLGGAFHGPAMQASTTLMVPDTDLARVGGMNHTLFGAAGIAIPPLGALMLAWLPMQGILAVDIVTALLAIVPLLFIAIPQPRPIKRALPGQSAVRSLLSDMGDGLRFLWSWPGILLIVLIGTVIRLLVWPGAALMPLLVTNHFGGGALQLAWLRSGDGVGMILGGLLLTVWGGFRRRTVISMAALALDGLCIAVLGLAPANGLLLAIAAMLCSGILEAVLFALLGAVGQAVIPPGLQGRVFSLSTALGMAAGPIGLAVAGPLADAIGVQFWFVVGGAAMAAMGVAALFVPAITRIEERAAAEKATGQAPVAAA